MRISTYNVNCPDCRVAGVDRPLGFDPEAGGICCEANPPHVYAELPGESQVLKPAEVAPKSPTTEDKTHQAEKIDAEPVEVVQGRFSEVLAARQAAEAGASTGEVVGVAGTPVRPPQLVVPRVRYPIDQLGPGQVVGHAATFEAVAEGEMARLPNGDVLVGMRISEQWIQAIQAEAENQGQPFTQYLQDYLNEVALQNSWSNSPAPR